MQIAGFMRGVVSCAAGVAVAMTVGASIRLNAEGGAAFTGVVTSQEEGKMEGVLVTARREGAAFDVTVVSDAKGKYSFPRSHVQPGTYALKIRAIGYDLAGPNSVEVAAGKTATLDLRLQKTQDLSSQITSAEWLTSLPGTDEQKAMVQRQKFDDAIAVLELGSKIFPSDVPLLNTLANAYAAKGDVVAFWDSSRRALAINRNDPTARRALGLVR